MKPFILVCLVSVCGAASAQTPAANPMPDGSRDMYLGVGAVFAPSYPGAQGRRTRALPLIQMASSNGIFVSGMNMGMHLSEQPSIEYGPLLSLHASRDRNGDGRLAGGVNGASVTSLDATGDLGVVIDATGKVVFNAQRGMLGMDRIGARLQGGAFFNYYLSPAVRLTSSALYGAGEQRNGLVITLGVQRLAAQVSSSHKLTLGAGASLANASYNDSYFGVQPHESLVSGYRAYAPGAGLKDVYVAAGWNWALSPSWILTSNARITRLAGPTRHSPLIERPTNLTITTGIAYRF